MADVCIRSWEATYETILSAEYIREKNATRLERFKQNITNENDNAYVIQKDGKTIGIMKIAPTEDYDLGDSFYELHYIYLHPDYFRKGIGTHAINFAFDKARALGKKFISVWVFSKNKDSIKFYEKYGFKTDGKTQTHDRRGKQMECECIRMRKIL